MPPMTCEELEGLRSGILDSINRFQEEKLNPAIQELKDNQEWDKFTIAFYGETGAGKSTIIESLRIKLEEPTKKQQQLNFLEAKLVNNEELLEQLRDGAIIGDGRSDYTLETTSYDFSYIDKKFSILDVPGIEGTEKKVWNEISKAISKAHAVFYVTSSPKPLQIGDDNVKGTLEKIKESLGAQTGIYGLYNKRIKNPIVLKKTAYSQ